jgi:hypothetical protein
MFIRDLFETSPERQQIVWQKRGKELTQVVRKKAKTAAPASRRTFVVKDTDER